MKNLFAAILVTLTVGTSSFSFATVKIADKGKIEQTVPATATISQVLISKLDVVVENIPNSKTSIQLTDAAGRSIASRILSGKKLDARLRFDLTNLADGMYQVKVWDGGQNTQVQKFEVKTSEVSMASYQKLAIL